MLLHLRRTVIATIVLTLLCGLVYPLIGTGIAQAIFPEQANGSMTPFGSTLIGQAWKGPDWFQGRPSATVNSAGLPTPYDAMASGGSNLGPRSRLLEREVAARAATLRSEGISPTVSLVTASASGLDPDIAPGDALAQIPTISKATHISTQRLRQLVVSSVQTRQFGFLGAPYVNVLLINEKLASLEGVPNS